MDKDIRIFDVDTHISTEGKKLSIEGEVLLDLMDKYGIEKSLITLLCGEEIDEECNYSWLNKYVYQQSQKYPDRFVPLGWINPRCWSVEECKKNIRIQKEEYGFKATKLNPFENYFNLLDPERSLPVIEEIAKAGLMLAFHGGDDVRSNPDQISAVADLYPELTMIMIHMGQKNTHHGKAIEAAAKHSNIYLVGSNIEDFAYVRKAVDTIGSKRVCFGSDAPFCDQGEYIAGYERALDGLGKDVLIDVMGQNIRDLFGVK